MQASYVNHRWDLTDASGRTLKYGARQLVHGNTHIFIVNRNGVVENGTVANSNNQSSNTNNNPPVLQWNGLSRSQLNAYIGTYRTRNYFPTGIKIYNQFGKPAYNLTMMRSAKNKPYIIRDSMSDQQYKEIGRQAPPAVTS